MTPPDSHAAPLPPHVAELRRSLEEDPGSRLFLQLAEEYRRLGRHGEALEVLERGLERHPRQVSAHVALGRSRLETGDAEGAVEVLSRAIELDPTNLVANKLLVEAHLAEGDRDLARQRLDLYLLLNEGDPQADELRRRVGRSGGAADGDATADARSGVGPADDGQAAGLGWDAGWMGEESPRSDPDRPSSVAASTNGRGEPFGELGDPAARRAYLIALGAGGIFRIEIPPEVEAPQAEASGADEPHEPTASAAPREADETEEDRPTVTLGELYLAQGHPRQAERIFAGVLEREPGHGAAADGLERSRAAVADGTAASDGATLVRELLAEADEDAPPRVALLYAYLARIRRSERSARAGGA